MLGTSLISTSFADPTKKDAIERDNSAPHQSAQSWLINAVSDAYKHPSKDLAEVAGISLGIATAAFVIGTKGKGTEFLSTGRNILKLAGRVVEAGEADKFQPVLEFWRKPAAKRIAEFEPGLTEIEQSRMAQLGPELEEISREWLKHEVLTPIDESNSIFRASLDIPQPAPGTYQASLMSAGGLHHYLRNLRIPAEELDQNWRILDLGSGSRQNFARDCRQAKLRSTIFSLDPRLAMSDLEDVNRGLFRGVRGTNELERLYGRRFPQPNTLAGEGTKLPFADTTFKRVYAHYSVPMYLGESVKVLSAADEEKIATSIAEIKRVLQPGGIARIFPVPDYQVETVEKSLSKLGLRPFTDQTEPTILPNQTFRFERFRPWDPRINRRYYVRGRYVGPPCERLLTFRT